MSSTDDQQAVLGVIASLVEAWGRNDAETYGALFTEDATYITFAGTYYHGRRDIIDCHRALFAKFLKGTRLADETLDVRFVSADAAVVTGRGDTYKGDQPKKRSKIQTYTIVRDTDGRWRVAAFQNTKRKALMEAISFKTAPGTIPAAQRGPADATGYR